MAVAGNAVGVEGISVEVGIMIGLGVKVDTSTTGAFSTATLLVGTDLASPVPFEAACPQPVKKIMTSKR